MVQYICNKHILWANVTSITLQLAILNTVMTVLRNIKYNVCVLPKPKWLRHHILVNKLLNCPAWVWAGQWGELYHPIRGSSVTVAGQKLGLVILADAFWHCRQHCTLYPHLHRLLYNLLCSQWTWLSEHIWTAWPETFPLQLSEGRPA